MEALYPNKCKQWQAMDFPVDQISIAGAGFTGKDGASANDINSACRQLGVAFVEWRYLSETLPLVGDVSKLSSFDFKAVFACAQTIGEEIETMQGGFSANINVSVGTASQ
jgi:hypothetical protein